MGKTTMDLSIILSIVAIVVSVVVSGITLLLTQFQGPDISLINSPEFEVSDDSTQMRFKELLKQNYIPTYLELTKTPFVFANHGGKSGTILTINCEFAPSEEFKMFFKNFYCDITLPGKAQSTATTIREGDNKTLIVSSSLHLINWKMWALAQVLDSSLATDELITIALEKGKDTFQEFCSFLENSRTLGTIECTISFTKGRFRTKVVSEALVKNVPLQNNCDQAIQDLRGFLQTWENREPRRTQLLNGMKQGLEGVTRELKDNFSNLGTEVNDQNVGTSKLKVDTWQQFCSLSEPCEKEIRWFLIRSQATLEKDLVGLYENIGRYNDLIDSALARGEFRTSRHFRTINEKRIELKLKVQTVVDKLSALCLRYIT